MTARRFVQIPCQKHLRWYHRLFGLTPKIYYKLVEVPSTEGCVPNPAYEEAPYQEIVLRGDAVLDLMPEIKKLVGK